MRRELRAALIAAAVLVHGFAAAPLPRSVKASDLAGPIAADELKRWSELLTGLGLEATPADLKDLALDVGGSVAAFRQAVIAPARPFFRFTGTGQAWGLFTFPDTRPRRLVVEGSEGGQWRPLYRALEPEYDWHGEVFRYRRIRAPIDAYTRKQRPGEIYERFADHTLALALEENPELDAARLLVERLHSVTPDRTPDPPQRQHLRVRTR